MSLHAVLIALMTLPAALGSNSIDLAAPDTPHLAFYETGALRYDHPRFLGLLGQGWRTPYSGDLVEHSDAIWATSIHAELELFVLEPRNLLLQLVMRPHAVEAFDAQTVAVIFNDTRLGQCAFTKEDGWAFKQFTVAVPASAVVSGLNTLTFLSRFSVSAKDVGRGGDTADGRAVAFGIQALALVDPGTEPGFDTPRPEARFAGNTITLPPGARVVVPVNLEHADRVALSAETSGGAIRLEQDHFPGITSHELTPGPDGVTQAVDSDGPLRLVFDHPGGADAAVWKAPKLNYSAASGQDTVTREALEKPAVERVVVIVHDTLRADATGFGGALRNVTPFMDGVAAKGMVYTQAYTHSAWTYPSIVSGFTGLYPVQHGVHHQGGALAPEVPVLAEALKAAGIVTGCIAENPYFSPRNGLGRGYDTYEYVYPTQATGGPRGSDTVIAKAKDFVAAHARDRFFLYLQFFPPHAPYSAENPHANSLTHDIRHAIPPDDVAMHDAEIGNAPMSAEGIAHLRARYDENVQYADDMTRQVFEMLEANGLGAETAIIITSDHGESFGEHGFLGHSDVPYEAQVHVPFVYVLGPEGTGPAGVQDAFVHTVDLAPTVAELLGAEVPASYSGTSLFVEDSHSALHILNRMQAEEQHPPVAYRTPRFKLIVDPAGNRRELYDIVLDPHETANLVRYRPVLADYIEAQGRAWERAQREKAGYKSGEAVTISDEERNQLETLGYF